MHVCKDLVEHIVKTLVDKPEAVIITAVDADGKIGITIKVDDTDLGRIIGKDGQTIRALRALALVVAPHRQEVNVDVLK